MSQKTKVDVYPEFGYELACSIPYAYWLHQNGLLDKVVTCEGMTPFYYFTDDVEERYTQRSIDNGTNGVQNLPNTWIHHNSMAVMGKDYSELTDDEKYQVNGVLDYSQWTPPPFKEQYWDDSLDLPEKYVVVSNRYNLEHGEKPVGYFDIQALYTIFDQLIEAGYEIIYKRPRNTEFATDSNEWLGQDIVANVEGLGMVNDYQLCKMMGVRLIDKEIERIGEGYNTSQLKIFARSSGFISMGGGSSILCSYFRVPVIIYVNTSKDIRPGYFDGDSYFNKLSDAPIYPIVDKKADILQRGYRDYTKVYETINQVFYQANN